MLPLPPADGTWQNFQIRILPYPEASPSTVTLAIGFKIDSDPESYITSNRIPTGPLFPFLMVYPKDAGEKAIEVDSFNVQFIGGNTH